MEVTLNGVPFLLRGFPKISRAQRPPVQLADNQGRRTENTPVPRYAFSPLSSGIGYRWWNQESGWLWMATANTFWPGVVSLPLRIKSTETGGTEGQLLSSCVRGGSLYAFWLEGSALRYSKWTEGCWEAQASTIATGLDSTTPLVRAVAAGTRVYVLYELSGGGLRVAYSSDMASWTVLDPSLNSPGDIVFSDTSNKIFVVGTSSSNLSAKNVSLSSDSWSADWLARTMPYGSGSVSAELFLNSSSQESLFIGTSYGVLLVRCDDSVSAPQKLLNVLVLPDNSDNCNVLKKIGAALYIPTQDLGLLSYAASGTLTPVGLDIRDGLPADYNGFITAITEDRGNLYVAVKGDTYSGIYAFDGTGWHNFWVSTTNPRIYTLNATSTSLVFSDGAASHKHLSNYHTNPILLDDSEYESEGYLDYCYFGAYQEEELGTFIDAAIHATNLFVDARNIEVWGKVDEDTDLEFLGKVDDASNRIRFEDAGGLSGFSARLLQLRLILKRGVVKTDTPHLHFPVVAVQKTEGKRVIELSFYGEDALTVAGLQAIALSTRPVRVKVEGEELVCVVLAANWRAGEAPVYAIQFVEL